MTALTPSQLARSGSEDGHQAALFCAVARGVAEGWLNPRLKLLHAIPNGGSRGDTAKSRAIQGGKLKATGTKRGVPDTMLPIAAQQYHGLYVELKRPKSDRGRAGVTFNSQEQWHKDLTSEGYCVAVCIGWTEAYRVIMSYMGYKSHEIADQLLRLQ